MSKKVLITGISGFIGKHLAKRLVDLGYEVTGVVNNDTTMSGVSIVKLDIVKDLEKIKEACVGQDVLIHLAAVTTHNELVNETDLANEVNYIGTKNFLDNFSGSVFIYPSSGKVYGEQKELPFSENMKCNPTTVLGELKLKIEDLIKSFSNIDRNFTVFRVFNVYGPGQRESFLIPTIIKQIESGSIILGDVNGKRDFIFIDDLVEGFVKVIEEGSKGFNVYNVGTGFSYNPKEIVEVFGTIKGKKLKIKIDGSKLRVGEFDEERADVSKLMMLGWSSPTSLKEGLKKCLNIKN